MVLASLDDVIKVAARGRGIHGAVYEITLKDRPDAAAMAMKEIELQQTNEASCVQIVRELDILKRGTHRFR